MKRSSKNGESEKKPAGQGFVQHWSPHESKREYDALEDPHAKYYFINKCVNQHLKALKKAIKCEPNQTEKKKLTHKIDTRLTAKFPVLKQATPKTIIYLHEITRSEKEMKTHLRRRSLLNSTTAEAVPASASQLRKQAKQLLIGPNKSSTGDIEQAPSRAYSLEQAHLASHNKFLDFLARKKSVLRYPSEMAVKQGEEPPQRQWREGEPS